MLEWREGEHELMENEAMDDLETMRALKNCGLYNFWAIQGMKVQVELLTWLVNAWDMQYQCFIIGDHRLVIEPEDIYFLTEFPHRG